MLLICYPKCSTCKKAEKYLKEMNIEYEYRDISVNNPTYAELKKWHKLSSLDIKKLFNTSGLKYRSLNLKDKLLDMSLDEQLKLLSGDGMLVKRPVLIKDDKVLFGFKEEEWNELFK